MHRFTTRAIVSAAIGLVGTSTAVQSEQADDLKAVLAKVGRSVVRHFERAQSIVCLETVRLQSLGFDLGSDGAMTRHLSYELRVAWDPPAAGGTPEATVLRQLLKVNGRPPRAKDEPGCMDPKPVSPEPLAMFLPAQQEDYVFTLAGRGKVHGRPAVMIDYKSKQGGPISVTGQKDCLSIELPGRTRGRVWIDAESDEVLRLDEHLAGMYDVPLPREHQVPFGPSSLTVERVDSSIVYRPVSFSEPDEIVMLPRSIDTLTIIRNSGVPRRRTSQTFSNYQRFMTMGRVVRD